MMGDLDMLREWAHELSQGPATVTVEFTADDGKVVRYTIPHFRGDLTITKDMEESIENGRTVQRPLDGYRVTLSGDTRFRGGDDQMTRETVSD